MEHDEPLVVVRGLSRYFGGKAALERVSLEIRPGTVLGLVGENGAGKTTLIRHILGLLKAETGSVRVFGKDPVADPPGVLSRIGYLSEDADLPTWMRLHELLRYSESFYPTWDRGYAERLREEFGLNPAARLRDLSKGQRARAGLLVALAYRPDLLVLDEPSSGLDPMVRRDILAAVIRTIAEEGRTVLFSSHLLSEVERVADQVAMMRSGRLLFCSTLEHLKETHCRLTLRLPTPRENAPQLDGALLWEGSDREWTAFCQGSLAQLEGAAAVLGAEVVRHHSASLDEIFVAQASAPIGAPA